MRLVYQLISYAFKTSQALRDRIILPYTSFSTESTSSLVKNLALVGYHLPNF